MNRSTRSPLVPHLFDTKSIDVVGENLGVEVAQRIVAGNPTLCDLISACFLLGRDPLAVCDQVLR